MINNPLVEQAERIQSLSDWMTDELEKLSKEQTPEQMCAVADVFGHLAVEMKEAEEQMRKISILAEFINKKKDRRKEE